MAERTAAPATALGEEVHSDVWGTFVIQQPGGQRCYITFTDDYSRYTWAQPLNTMDEAIRVYKAFAAWPRTRDLHGYGYGSYLGYP
jgi:hypothetical protein